MENIRTSLTMPHEDEVPEAEKLSLQSLIWSQLDDSKISDSSEVVMLVTLNGQKTKWDLLGRLGRVPGDISEHMEKPSSL